MRALGQYAAGGEYGLSLTECASFIMVKCIGDMRTSQVAVTMKRLERRILVASASEPDQSLTLTQGVSVLSASSE